MEEVWNHIEVVQSRHPAVEKVRCQLFAMLHWRQKTRELGSERRLENFSAEPFQSLDRESNSYLSSTACSEIQQLTFRGNFCFFHMFKIICVEWMDPIESDQKSCLVIVGKNWRPFFRSWKASLSSPTTPTGPNASFTLQSNFPNSVFAQTVYAIRSIRSIGNIPDCNYVGFPLSGVVVSALKSPSKTTHSARMLQNECIQKYKKRQTKEKQKTNKSKDRHLSQEWCWVPQEPL